MSTNDKPDFSAALTLGRTLDLKLPDSGAVRDAHDQAQAESPAWLFNHVGRQDPPRRATPAACLRPVGPPPRTR
jgi:hypothetical protein